MNMPEDQVMTANEDLLSGSHPVPTMHCGLLRFSIDELKSPSRES